MRDSLAQLPAFHDERPLSGPRERTVERGRQIEALLVVEPDLLVPAIALVVREGSLN